MPQIFAETDLQKSNQIFVVTGANRGIGYGIVEKLATQIENGIIYITSLKESDGKSAIESLTQSLGENKKSELRCHQLDVTSAESCKKFKTHLKECHGKIDVLINNAGVAFYLETIKTMEEKYEKGWHSMNVNYFGTKQITLNLLPLIKPGGRVVNICSQLGKLQHHNNLKCLKEDTCTKNGFHESPYRLSKSAEIALTVLQKKLFKDKEIKFYAACPGYVSTAMTLFKGTLTIQEGADTPTWLATNENAPDGVLVFQRKIMEWY
uniref:Uncharacterized protein n=1 Tax=Panagrolaimus davidi TaxID=227884 RepID=A0A914PXR8_9BILA